MNEWHIKYHVVWDIKFLSVSLLSFRWTLEDIFVIFNDEARRLLSTLIIKRGGCSCYAKKWNLSFCET